MLKYILIISFNLIILIGLIGCNHSNTSYVTTIPQVNQNLPQVVSTTSVLCSLIKQVAMETINLTCLIPSDADPHLYEANSQDRQAINQAKLIFYNGYNFEPSLIRLIKGSNNHAPKIAVAEDAISKPLRFRENDQIVTDPHIWHDVKNAIKMLNIINTHLDKLIPENAKIYDNNTQDIISELTQLDKWVKIRIASIPKNKHKLVTNHYAFGYYVKAYGFSFSDAVEGITTTEKVSNAQIQGLIKSIKRNDIPTIFAETTINPNLVNSIAKQAKINASDRELFADNLGINGSEGDTYQKMMTANTRIIVEGLGGTYLIFEPTTSNP